ncbi:hypothetical protein, partial [Parabacteroides goldsteinii]|uniref:hypothetical protein n=1 Tax=Parabacteroides goldsteinii TaxID=328812 RepID=UPI0025ADB014
VTTLFILTIVLLFSIVVNLSPKGKEFIYKIKHTGIKGTIKRKGSLIPSNPLLYIQAWYVYEILTN